MKVQLYVYDLSGGLAATFSHLLLGSRIEAIWHTSVVLDGNLEIFYGQGVQMYHSPGNTMYGRPVRIVEMGITELSIDIIEQFIGEMSQEKYAADSYHLLRNNCNDFTNDLCQFLVGKCIPSNITGLPGEFLSTELGQQLGVHLDGMFTRETDEQTSMTQLYGQELSNSPNSVPVLQSKSQLENIDIALVVYIDRTQGRLIASELKTIVETHGRIPKGVWGSGNVGISAFTAGTELVEGNKRLPVAVVYHRGKNVKEVEGVSSSDLCQLISTTIAETFVIHPHKDVRISLLDNYNPSRSAFDANTVTLKTVTDFVDNKDIQVQDIESIHRVTLVYWQLRLQNYGILDVTADKLNSTQMHVEQHSTPDCLLELLSLIVRLLSSPNSHTVETKAKLKSTLLHLLHFGAEDCLSLFRLLREDSKECWDFHDSLGMDSFNSTVLTNSHHLDNSQSNQSQTKRLSIRIEGMTCSSCVNSIETKLLATAGIRSASISLLAERADVEYDPSILSQDDCIPHLVDDMGFSARLIDCPANTSSAEVCFELSKRSTADISNKQHLMDTIRSIAGVESVDFFESDRLLRLRYSPYRIGARDIEGRLRGMGLNTKASSTTTLKHLQHGSNATESWRYALYRSLWCSIPVFVVNHWPWASRQLQMETFIPGLFVKNLLELCLTIPVQFGVGKRFYRNAYKSLLHGSATMDLLVALSTTIAFVFSLAAMAYSIFSPEVFQTHSPTTFFGTCTMLITFVVLGKHLESIAKGKTRASLEQFYQLRPAYATLYNEHSGAEQSIPIEMVQLDDILKVKPGQKIPVDGTVVKGSGLVDESLVTGESLPISKGRGDMLIGGSINYPQKIEDASCGVLYMRVTRVGQETVLSQIIRMVETAQTSKPPIQAFADRVSTVFVPLVLALSIVTFAYWYSVLSAGDQRAIDLLQSNFPGSAISPQSDAWTFAVLYVSLKIAMTVLVVSCPCALGLATPTAVMVGTGVAAKHGILIKSGLALEKLRKTNVLLLDKTGTLTEGKLEVHDSIVLPFGLSESLFMNLIAVAEAQSDHPVAKCLGQYCAQVAADLGASEKLKLVEFSEKLGSGVWSRVDVKGSQYDVVIGNIEWLSSELERRSNDHLLSNDERQQLAGFAGAPQNCGDLVVFCVAWPTTMTSPLNEQHCKVISAFSLRDKLKSDAFPAIQFIRNSLNIDVYMVTGDRPETALSVARRCGIPAKQVFAGINPAGKKSIVEAMQKQQSLEEYRSAGVPDQIEFIDHAYVNYSSFSVIRRRLLGMFGQIFPFTGRTQNIVAMFGDGINDSPALAQADAGITLCNGSEIAKETADIVLVKSNDYSNDASVDFQSLLTAFELTRVIYRRIIYNFTWAFVYNIIALPVAMGVFFQYGFMMSPGLASFMMAMSSISVVLNSLLINRFRPTRMETLIENDEKSVVIDLTPLLSN